MGADMRELIEYVARALVDSPQDVQVREEDRRGTIHLELKVAEEDLGRVIGRGGRVANAMRALLRVAAAQRGSRAELDIL